MQHHRLDFQVTPGGTITAELSGPRDKSISQRAVIMASIANGTSYINNILNSDDVNSCINAMRALKVTIEKNNNDLVVYGVGKTGLQSPKDTIDCGNSGTCMRLLTGLLSGQDFSSELTGDSSLRNRPMSRIITPLEQMGAKIIANNNKPPLTIIGSKNLQAINYKMNIASAQLQSSILLAALYAKGDTQVTTPSTIRDHTQRMLTQFGCKLQSHNNSIVLHEQQLTATDINIPVDFSSVCFFMVAALITKNSEIILTNVGINTGRIGALTILLQMGANITCINKRELSGEPVADIIVRSSQLQGINIASKYVASAIDEWPILLVAAACASGVTRLHGAKELRYKETDRIAAIAVGLKQLGVTVIEHDDGITVKGIGSNNKFNYNNIAIESYHDHRIAMAFIIAGLVADTPVTVTNCQSISTSYPNFITDANNIGIDVQLV